MKALLITGLVALALTGCNSLPSNPLSKSKNHEPKAQHDKHHHQHGHAKKTKFFICDNDAEPAIRRINEDQIELVVDGQATLMNAAVSGSGERYVSKTGVYGKGGEWHQKADEATFTYYDVGSPANCKVK